MIADPAKLLDLLRSQPRESEWLEFKLNQFEKDEVGKYVSGLANAAMLVEKQRAYLVFGIEDKTHRALGTTIRLKDEKVGNQLFEQYLNLMLHPSINVEFVSTTYQGKHIEIIAIDPGYISPVRFKNEAFIRVDSVQQPLRLYSEKERAIWATTSRFCFEDAVAATHMSAKDIVKNFDCVNLMQALTPKGSKQPQSAASHAEKLSMERLIVADDQDGFDISNLLAVVAAFDMRKFEPLRLKPARVIVYTDKDKLEGSDDRSGIRGYAISFETLLDYIMDKIPHKEVIAHGKRGTKYSLPQIAIREFLANALIHQDLSLPGPGPRVEIFSDRTRITNPGTPLISPDRFIDAPPRSRNEKLSLLMRRAGLCEGRGSGIDRALDAIEAEALPPPFIQVVEGHTVVTIYAQRSFAAMTNDERLRACYQHASLKAEAGETMSNQSLRARFGLTDRQYPQVSNVIRAALDAKLIFPLDQDQGNRNARYVPWWAK